MKVLTFTRLWPNSEHPTHGVFVAERMRRFADLPGCSLRVMAPVPYYPRLPFPERYSRLSRIAHDEIQAGIPVDHPRYLVIPKIGMRLQGRTLLAGCLPGIRRLHQAGSVDVIDAHFLYPDGFAAIEAGRRLGVPVILSARGSDANVDARKPGIGPMIRRTLSGAAAIVAVSRALASRLVDLGANPSRVRVIPNGIDAELFRPWPGAREEIRAVAGAREGEALLLSVGRLEPVKGHDILIEALARYSRSPQARPFRLAIVGEGARKDSLLAQARAAGILDRIAFVGSIPHADLPAWLSSAELFCLPSRNEGHPNALLEALACGTPAVATRVGATPGIVSQGNGVLVEPEDPEALADGLRTALRRVREGGWDPDSVRLTVSGRSWTHVAEECRSVFLDALEGRYDRSTGKARTIMEGGCELR